MIDGYSFMPFEECAEVIKAPAKIPSAKYKQEGTYPIVSQEKELICGYWDDNVDLFCHKTPVVVFGDHTMVVKYIDFDFVVGADGVKILMPKSFLIPKYFYYWTSSVRIKSRGYARHFRYLKETVVPVLPLFEQQRIIDILDAEFAKIDTLKENAEKNLQNAKDLFQAVLRKELEPKEGWEMKALKQIGKTQTGTTPKTANKEYYGTYIPFIKPSDVNIDGIGGLNYANEGLSEMGASVGRVFEPNSILMVCIGATIGKVGHSERQVSSNQQINVLTPHNGYESKYLYYYMASPVFQHEVISNGESAKATLPIINKSKWENLCISYPCEREQKEIVERLDKLSKDCKNLEVNYERTITLCNELKQALLRKAFNGEL